MTLPLWADLAIPAACFAGMVAVFAWALCRAAAAPGPDTSPPDPVEPGATPRSPAPGSGDGPMREWDMEAGEYFAEWSQR